MIHDNGRVLHSLFLIAIINDGKRAFHLTARRLVLVFILDLNLRFLLMTLRRIPPPSESESDELPGLDLLNLVLVLLWGLGLRLDLDFNLSFLVFPPRKSREVAPTLYSLKTSLHSGFKQCGGSRELHGSIKMKSIA